jgi:hypothetical protein
LVAFAYQRWHEALRAVHGPEGSMAASTSDELVAAIRKLSQEHRGVKALSTNRRFERPLSVRIEMLARIVPEDNVRPLHLHQFALGRRWDFYRVFHG